jgi:hypothetical protein
MGTPNVSVMEAIDSAIAQYQPNAFSWASAADGEP